MVGHPNLILRANLLTDSLTHYQMINSGFWVHDAELDKVTY